MSQEEFDFIVVGAGSAGCVAANRLSADPKVRVALIEAGESDRKFPLKLKTMLPFGNIFVLPDARYNWSYKFDASEAVKGREIGCPRGRLMGGCSSLNGAVYNRGHASDYDDWEAQGLEGWGYSEVLRAFKAHENWQGPNSQFHSTGGELDVTLPRSPNPISLAFIKAAEQAGYPLTDDFNGAQQEGFGFYHVNQKRGIRQSTSRAFIDPVLNRPNLKVFDRTMVDRIEITDGAVTGLRLKRDGQTFGLRVRREVILSGGTINSPQLLMLSGIGPKEELRKHGIDVVVDLPGVGQNLQDHPSVGLAMTDPSHESMALNMRALPKIGIAGAQYMLTRNGMFSSNASEAGGYLRTLPGQTRPDVQMTLLIGLKTSADRLPNEHGIVLHSNICRPESRGRVYLKSASGNDKPGIYSGFLTSDDDLQTLVRALKAGRNILSQPAFARHRGTELTPGPARVSDEDLALTVRENLATLYHPVGTCKMGVATDKTAVVDNKLRVMGVRGLRVADASVIPRIMGANTSAPSMMIGERVAAFAMEDAMAMA